MKIKFHTIKLFGNRPFTLNWWTFYPLPTIAIQRQDKFADEAAYYIGVMWIVFQIYILIRTKK